MVAILLGSLSTVLSNTNFQEAQRGKPLCLKPHSKSWHSLVVIHLHGAQDLHPPILPIAWGVWKG